MTLTIKHTHNEYISVVHILPRQFGVFIKINGEYMELNLREVEQL